MENISRRRKFPAGALLLLAAILPAGPRGQSAPAAAPAAAAPSPARETQFPLPPIAPQTPAPSPAPPPEPAPDAEQNIITVPIRPAGQYAVKRAQILLAEERRDPALLMGLFQDAEAQVRARTARALGRIGYPGSAEVLAILLADPAPEVQAGAAWGALYLGKEAQPLVPALRALAAQPAAARIPALETLIALGDLESAPLVLQAIENSPELRPQLAGHLFRLDTPAVRVMLKSWASNGRDLASQTGALASLVRLKADDEPFYRDILAQSTNEPAVWAVKGLGLAKTPAPETIAALESAAKREHDPLTRDEALKQLIKSKTPSALKIFREGKLAGNAQTETSMLDGLPADLCLISHVTLGDQTSPSYKDSGLDHDYFFKAIHSQVSHQRRLALKCSTVQYKRFSFKKEASFRVRAALAENEQADFTELLQTYGKEKDSRVRSSAAGALIQRGGSVNPWLADKSAEVIANAADTASKLKPEEVNPKRISGAALMKAYQRFSLKKAEDGPNTRMYIVRAAAACAEKQPACLNVLKSALKDHVRTVQINAWERWPEKLQKTRPAWPKPNLPRPDFLGAETRLQSLLDHPPHFEVVTTQGKFTMLFTARGEAPLNVLNFRKLVAKRYFDGITWHRVVPNFVVQAGDPRGDGSGGPGWMIPCEYNSFPYKAGTVGMALDGKDSGGSQWFITLTAQPHLDYRYTVMGQVDSGLEVAYKLGEDDKIVTLREIGAEDEAAGATK